jgi:hypothetical protein
VPCGLHCQVAGADRATVLMSMPRADGIKTGRRALVEGLGNTNSAGDETHDASDIAFLTSDKQCQVLRRPSVWLEGVCRLMPPGLAGRLAGPARSHRTGRAFD